MTWIATNMSVAQQAKPQILTACEVRAGRCEVRSVRDLKTKDHPGQVCT